MSAKTIVITGSTRGIGLGLAREFLRLGHQVVVTGRSVAAVDKALADLAADPVRVLGVPCDIRQVPELEALWRAAVARFGRVDVWINNAAVATDRALLTDLAPDQIAATVETNLLGTLYGCRTAIAGMLKQGGGKVYTFEGFGSNGMTSVGLTTYGATKSAVRYLTAALVKEFAGTPVCVGSLSPGIVATDLLVYSSRTSDPVAWAKARRVMNILGDRVETVTPWLATQALANSRHGARIEWLTPAKAAWRFATAAFHRRDILSAIESRTDLHVR
jgi:NAD(P)-dependent dehydrogenase (short-subunit alcohol dehydrogenase family)